MKNEPKDKPGSPKPLVPSAEEAVLARECSRQLAAVFSRPLGKDQTVPITLERGSGPLRHLRLPVSAVRLLLGMLEEMARGNAVTLLPIPSELTTQAADLLGVSRPHLVRLLDGGKIPYRKVGSHRRVRAHDVLEYRGLTEQKRRAALDQLAIHDQELGLE